MNQVLVLPYAGLDGEIRMGPFVFWPWADICCRNRYIRDQTILDRVKQEVNRHVDYMWQPINCQCLVSCEDDKGNHLAGGKVDSFSAALALLAFAYLLPVTRQNPPLPEMFEAFEMPLVDAGHGYTIASEGLHNLTRIILPSGVSSLRFQAPREVDCCLMKQRKLSVGLDSDFCSGISDDLPDADIIGIGDRILKAPLNGLSRRALQAIRWHNLALRQDEALDPGQRAVALCTAFEVLFNVGTSHSKAKFICQEVDGLLSKASDKRYKVPSKDPKNAYTLTRASFPVYRLYKWRNKVVHGEQYGIPDGTIRLRCWGRRNLVLVCSRILGRCFKKMLS